MMPSPSLAVVLVLTVAVAGFGASNACSCMLSHPQHQYCEADYVVLARVRSSTANVTTVALNVKISKVFKMTDKATHALRHHTIYTPINDGLCGVSLHRDTKYLLTGRVLGGKHAWINTCDTYREWDTLSAKQKKGFRLLYSRGCECKVLSCPWWSRHVCSEGSNTCSWTTAYEPSRFDCQGNLSICMRQPNGRCEWNRSRAYRSCIKASRNHREEALRKEP